MGDAKSNSLRNALCRIPVNSVSERGVRANIFPFANNNYPKSEVKRQSVREVRKVGIS